MLRQVLLDGEDWSLYETIIILKFAYKNNDFEYNVKLTKKGSAQYIFSQNIF